MDHSSWLSFFSERTKSQEESDVWVFAAKQMSFSVFSAGVVVFHCPNKGVRALVQTKKTEILALLREYLREEVRDVVFELKALKEDMGVKKPVAPTLFEYEPTIADIARQSGLNPRLTLENYAVSHCNNVAYAACQVVVTQVGSSYNPLFLWGGVGVGKTHLAQATAYRILQLHKNKRVYFCGGDKFTNEIIDAIRARTTDKFRQKYRRLDVLIVDDIQFIAGKQTVQQEFFHTFNDIIARGGQVILISDRPPQQIGDLEDRLRSRFAGGLIIDISPPDFELKTAIALIKAKERGIDVDIEFAKKIASQADDNRMLEGMLLTAYARALAAGGTSLDSPLTANSPTLIDASVRTTVTTDRVLQTVCLYFQLKPIHLRQQNRTGKVARARQILMYILRTRLKIGLAEIAHFIKRKDHTTILHGVQKIQELLIHDTTTQKEVADICQTLGLSTKEE